MGGDCIGSDLVRLSTGYDFTKMVIQTALGEKPNYSKVCKPSNAAVKYIFSKDKLCSSLSKNRFIGSEKRNISNSAKELNLLQLIFPKSDSHLNIKLSF